MHADAHAAAAVSSCCVRTCIDWQRGAEGDEAEGTVKAYTLAVSGLQAADQHQWQALQCDTWFSRQPAIPGTAWLHNLELQRVLLLRSNTTMFGCLLVPSTCCQSRVVLWVVVLPCCCCNTGPGLSMGYCSLDIYWILSK